jgi:hypothetical protein
MNENHASKRNHTAGNEPRQRQWAHRNTELADNLFLRLLLFRAVVDGLSGFRSNKIRRRVNLQEYSVPPWTCCVNENQRLTRSLKEDLHSHPHFFLQGFLHVK